MQEAVALEDKTEKHPVTPGEVIPAREWLGDMLMAMNKPAEALVEYKADLVKHPNRFNALYGAGLSAKRSHHEDEAVNYFASLTRNAGNVPSGRPELETVKRYALAR